MLRTLAAGLVVALIGGSVSALEVKLTASDTAGVARQGEPVTSGVPFAKGAVKDAARLGLKVGGKPAPAQFLPIVLWDDGSVRWALLDTQVDVPAGGAAELTVSDGGAGPAPAAPVKVEDGADAVKVSTGPLELVVDKKKFNVLKSVKVDGKELVTGAGRGFVIHKDGGGEVVAGAPAEVKVENAGPMRATVCLRGRFPEVHNGLLGYTVRITAYAGRKHLKVHAWLENDGGLTVRAPDKSKWFAFDGCALELGLGLGDKVEAECEGAKGAGRLKVEQRCPTHDWKGFAYQVTEGDKELKKGERTDGVVALSGPAGRLTVAVRHFWEQYEKAVELDGAALKVWLWPTDGEWPRSSGNRGHDSKEYPQYRKPGVYFLSGSTRKGHELILDLSGREARASAATLGAPLVARTEPAYVAGTEAAPGWFAPADFASGNAAYDAKVKSWNQCARNGVDPDPKNHGSLFSARRGGADSRGSWHGWMDFGDNLWAEGYSTLHYDWAWMMLLGYLRTGEANFLEMGTTMARHRIDVDQIWGQKDSPYYSGLSRYEKCYTSIHGGLNDGHYGPIPSHTWLSGVVLYYMLTGEPQARECALDCGEGLRRRLVSRFRDKPSPDGQSREAGWGILNMCSLYDLTADKKYLDDGLVLFRNSILAQKEKYGPYLMAHTGPGNCLQFYYGTQGFCELHQRTGDEGVMKYLKECCAGDFTSVKPAYDEWRIFLTNIYAYVGYVEKNDAYVKKAEELFSAYVPDGGPPCYKGGSGAWDKESGKMIRNGHILQYVEWKLKGGK